VYGKCTPVFPHQFLKTNTIFNVAREAGLYTAWSDKHPAYEIVNGPSGMGVNDLFTPEINNVNDPTTISVTATTLYDQLKVDAVVHEIDGFKSDGITPAPVPAIFGMNFQSVSVGEKLVNPTLFCTKPNTPATCDPNYFPGGYQPVTLKFTPQMAEAMSFVDRSIGSMASHLEAHGLLETAEIIISAKHGQSPIDPAKLNKVGDPFTPIFKNAGITVAQNTTDDIALIWLADQSQTAAALAALEADRTGANTAASPRTIPTSPCSWSTEHRSAKAGTPPSPMRWRLDRSRRRSSSSWTWTREH
jgi:hypothetical protein